jgi:recombination protein RecA
VPTKDKAATIAELEAVLTKRFGAGAIRRASDPSLAITRIPTGVLSVDYLVGGGFARNRHTELYGQYSVGKSYLAQRAMARAQALGLRCAYVNVEGSFDPVFAAHCGVNLDELFIPDELEHGNAIVDYVELLLRSQLYDMIVIDSIAALLPKEEREASSEKSTYGAAQAKLMSSALRKLTTANKSTSIVWINQLRDSMSMFVASTTSGGRAMGFYAGTRLELNRVEIIKREMSRRNVKTGKVAKMDVPVAHRVLLKVDKDKTGGARQFDQGTFVFDYESKGIDEIEDLIYVGQELDLIRSKSDRYMVRGYQNESQHGRPRFKAWLTKNRAVADELQELIEEVVYADH